MYGYPPTQVISENDMNTKWKLIAILVLGVLIFVLVSAFLLYKNTGKLNTLSAKQKQIPDVTLPPSIFGRFLVPIIEDKNTSLIFKIKPKTLIAFDNTLSKDIQVRFVNSSFELSRILLANKTTEGKIVNKGSYILELNTSPKKTIKFEVE